MEVIKRDGRIVSFDLDRITTAIRLCLESCQSPNPTHLSSNLSSKVLQSIQQRENGNGTISVERIQDIALYDFHGGVIPLKVSVNLVHLSLFVVLILDEK